MKIRVFNLPATLKKYEVVRMCGGEAWHWGTWDDVHEATSAAMSIGGMVYESKNIERG